MRAQLIHTVILVLLLATLVVVGGTVSAYNQCDEYNPSCPDYKTLGIGDPEGLWEAIKKGAETVGRWFKKAWRWLTKGVSHEERVARREEVRDAAKVVKGNNVSLWKQEKEKEALSKEFSEVGKQSRQAEQRANRAADDLVKEAFPEEIDTLKRGFKKIAPREGRSWSKRQPATVLGNAAWKDGLDFHTPEGTPEWEKLAFAQRYYWSAEQYVESVTTEVEERVAMLNMAEYAIDVADLSYAGGSAYTGDISLEAAESLLDSVFSYAKETITAGSTFAAGVINGALGIPVEPHQGYEDYFYVGEAVGAAGGLVGDAYAILTGFTMAMGGSGMAVLSAGGLTPVGATAVAAGGALSTMGFRMTETHKARIKEAWGHIQQRKGTAAPEGTKGGGKGKAPPARKQLPEATSGTLIGTSRATFRNKAANAIASVSNHPLRKLLDKTGKLRAPQKGMTHSYLVEHPEIVEMGHVISKKSGEAERIVLQSAWLNQFDRVTVEGLRKAGASYVENVVLDIGGIGVEFRTAADWVKAGLLDLEVYLKAPRIVF